MYASINGKTLVTIKDAQGKFHAVEIKDEGGYATEADALRVALSGILSDLEKVDERVAAKALLDDDEYFAGKTTAQKKAILQAAKVLGRTVWLHVRRTNGELEHEDFEVKIVGTRNVGLRNLATNRPTIISYDQIEGGYTNDPGTNE